MDIDAWVKSMKLLTDNNVVFVRKPNFRKKLLIGKDYIGLETKYDVTDQLIKTSKVPKRCMFDFEEFEYFSASKLSNLNKLVLQAKDDFAKEKYVHGSDFSLVFVVRIT